MHTLVGGGEKQGKEMAWEDTEVERISSEDDATAGQSIKYPAEPQPMVRASQRDRESSILS